MRPHRIVLHAGFHKTGTTSLQRCLIENREAIFPTHAIALNFRFPDLVHAMRGYSTRRDEATLTRATLRFAELIARLHMPPGRGLVISAEELAGHLPGREHVADYGALPELMAEFTQVLETAFPGRLDLVVFLSTRAPGPWLDSAWAEHVKSSRMRLDRAEFHARFAPAAELDAMAARLADALPAYPVVTARLEDTHDLPLGPASPLFDLMGLPDATRASLRPVTVQNARPEPAVLDELLALNRSDLPPDALKAAKRTVLTAHGSR